jgi:Ca-activated chloride channel family protein
MAAQSMARMGAVVGGVALPAPKLSRPSPTPGDIDRERYPNVDPNPVKSVASEPVSTFSIDVDTASYANVRRFLNRGQLPPKDAVRIEELINYFDYDYAPPAAGTHPFSSHVAFFPSPWSKGKTLLHIGLQGYEVRAAQRPALNLVLLIDVSGSMEAENKLPLVRQAMALLVDELTAKDRVALAVYAGSAGVVLEPTSGAEKGKIKAALERLSAGGSTAGGEGLALAYSLAEQHFNKNAVNRVILATDGDFNVGIADPEQLQDFVERKRSTGVYLSVLGFGGQNYNDALMQRLAQKGNGAAAYIDTLAEARKLFADQAASALLPIADDVKIQVEFNPARISEYRLIGYETRMLAREDFANDRVDAGEIGAGAAVTAIYELTPVGGKTLHEPLRYQQAPAPAAGPAGELAFLKIRYKLPGAAQSVLIDRPMTDKDARADLAGAPEAARFATAVAGFGQLLRGDPYLDPSFTYDSVHALAQAARGSDPFGWRAEFTGLVRAAKSASASPPTKGDPSAGESAPR